MYEKELQNLGLSEKEAKVYTTALELGPDTVQNIAKASGINRATTYVQISSLKSKGLMSEFEKGKKTYFTAENPEILSHIVEKDEIELNFRKLEVAKVIPELARFFSKASSASDRPKIRFFEGEDGVAQIRADFLKTKNETIHCFINFDQVIQKFTKNQEKFTQERVKRNVKSKIIYTRTAGKEKIQSEPHKLREMKFVAKTKFPFTADVTIYSNKIAIVSYSGTVGLIIENKEISDTFRAIFYLVWDNIKSS